MNAKSIMFVLVFTFLFADGQESVFQSLKKTDDLFVYEGLPHPLREYPSFKEEKNRNDIMQILGHWFYDKKVKAVGSTRDQLMNLLFNESGLSLLSPDEPPKDCGPFHPDYAIGWNYGAEKIFLMICYTCGEAKLLKEDRIKTYTINAYKMQSFANQLAKYKTNRPW